MLRRRNHSSRFVPRRSHFIQSLSLVLIALVFITIIIIVAVVYQKYRQVKRKVRTLKKNLLNIIPKMRVQRYNKIKYPSSCPLLLSSSLDSPVGITDSHFNTEIAKFLDKFIKSVYNLSAGHDHSLPSYVEVVSRLGENGYVFKICPDGSSTSYIIAYRGTNSREDILTDIDFSQTAVNGTVSFLIVRMEFCVIPVSRDFGKNKKSISIRLRRHLFPAAQCMSLAIA